MLMRNRNYHGGRGFLKKSAVYLACVFFLFITIGILTTIQPAYRFSSNMVTEWTSDIDGSVFLYLLGMENRSFHQVFPEERVLPELPSSLLQIATSIRPNDPRSLLGNELPGFSIFHNHILIAGEGTDYTNLPYESSPPLEEVLKEREAVVVGEEGQQKKETTNKSEATPTTGDKDVVFLYNSHNRESFLPHLPDISDPNLAHHPEVNITKVSERFADQLEAQGIGTQVDDTDIMSVLQQKDLDYGSSYTASREVVREAFSNNKQIQYVFDLHRDSISREDTTKEINGESYARIMIVVGAEFETYEQNLEFATELHYLIEEKYPGLSRGVLPKKGAGTNGVFNQDLSENALLLEFGGVENNMDELYRSADALAEVFSEFYWDAEAVDGN
ncbi:stage II sporulation protein P [Virgibacillus xinjiangensis]|uniref:Stage II sporulation protein P n=1 Tax=Virgibacillus xinjiangensis TaxID=393090 RepID=A0ABV7CRU4_9BACI